MAKTPETFEHTSIQMRIDHWQKYSSPTDRPVSRKDGEDEDLQPTGLLPFVGNHRQPMPKGIAFNLLDYIELVDWTGRAILDDKRGSIPTDAPKIIERLNIVNASSNQLHSAAASCRCLRFLSIQQI